MKEKGRNKIVEVRFHMRFWVVLLSVGKEADGFFMLLFLQCSTSTMFHTSSVCIFRSLFLS